jgi:hypothetical protein
MLTLVLGFFFLLSGEARSLFGSSSHLPKLSYRRQVKAYFEQREDGDYSLSYDVTVATHVRSLDHFDLESLDCSVGSLTIKCKHDLSLVDFQPGTFLIIFR